MKSFCFQFLISNKEDIMAVYSRLVKETIESVCKGIYTKDHVFVY
jgi:hypothetical protein